MLLTLCIDFTVNWKGSLLDKWRLDFHDIVRVLSVASNKVYRLIHAVLLLKLASRALRSHEEARFLQYLTALRTACTNFGSALSILIHI